jgi:hypothetical protein
MNIIKMAKRAGWGVVVLAALYVVALVISGVKLRNAQAELVAAGYPTKVEQIIPSKVKDEDNAALLYQAGVQRLKSEAVAGTNLFVRIQFIWNQSLSNQASQAVSNELVQFLGNPAVTEALHLVELGSAKPACRFNVDYTRGAFMETPHLADMRGLSRIVCARMRLEAGRGDTIAAWRSARTALTVADALKKDPLLFGYLVRVDQIGISCEAIRDMCGQIPVGEPDREALDRMLVSMDNNDSLRRALFGERISGIEWFYDEVMSGHIGLSEMVGDLGWMGGVMVSAYIGVRPLFQLDHAFSRRVYLALYKLAERPTWDIQVMNEDEMVPRVPRLYLFTTMYMPPAIPAVLKKQAFFAAELRLTRAALAVSAYKRKTGAWPKKLDSAGCGTLLDPFTGKPLVYRLDDRGPMVYCVGPDLKDDGGKPLNKGTRKGDIVWRP